MVQQLVIEVSKHEAVEEMYFWPAVRSHVTDGTDLANQAQGQEQEGKEVLAKLDKLAPEDEAFEAQLSLFITAGRAHIAFEETTAWPSLRNSLTAAEADDLGRKLEVGREKRPPGRIRRPRPRRGAQGRGTGDRGGGPAPRRGHWPRRVAAGGSRLPGSGLAHEPR